eukprot:PRCOL_00006536-RA
MLFSGTVVVAGRARAVVVGTGQATAIGQIRDSIARSASESKEELTPLKRKLDEFGEFLSKAIGVICLLVWVVNDAASPEPLVQLEVEGTTYEPRGRVRDASGAVVDHPGDLPALARLGACAALCNEAKLVAAQAGAAPTVIGEPTDAALKVLAEKIGLPGFDAMPGALDALGAQARLTYVSSRWEERYRRRSVCEFSRTRKMMSVLCEDAAAVGGAAGGAGRTELFVKGAPESVLARCTRVASNRNGQAGVPLTDSLRHGIMRRVECMTGAEFDALGPERQAEAARSLRLLYFVVGAYVGLATVGGFAWWFLSYVDGPRMSYAQLVGFHTCAAGVTSFGNGYGCEVFAHRGASTVAMTVLVMVEMFNALNALSENQSLLTLTPRSNKWLVGAIALSVALHCLVLYVPWLAACFSVTPLGYREWRAALCLSFGVVPLDEALKALTRFQTRSGGRRATRARPRWGASV